MRFSAVSPYNALPQVRLPEKIVIYDSTLRDGEQMPGVRFTPEQKVEIATKLSEIGVPQIEAGYPAVSDQEMKAVKMVSELGLDGVHFCDPRHLDSLEYGYVMQLREKADGMWPLRSPKLFGSGFGLHFCEFAGCDRWIGRWRLTYRAATGPSRRAPLRAF